MHALVVNISAELLSSFAAMYNRVLKVHTADGKAPLCAQASVSIGAGARVANSGQHRDW